MRFRLTAVACSVAIANAFLLPPEISSSDADIIDTIPFEDAVGIDGRVLSVSCPGCPVSLVDVRGQVHSMETPSILRLNFSIAHGDVDTLYLNDIQIYPMDSASQVLMAPLTADQMIKGPYGTWAYVSSPRLGYSLGVHHLAGSEQDHIDLVAVHFEIVEVADRFIDGIPAVDLKLLQTPTGKLMIGNVEALEFKGPSNPSVTEKECTNILCKWRAIIAGKISRTKGCSGKSRPTAAKSHASRPHGYGGPGLSDPPSPHRSHRHHHKHHGLARFLRGVVMHVFIPILIGIVAGITASLVGVVVGHVAIFLWRTLYRRGQKPTHLRTHQQSLVGISTEDESKGLVAHEGPPPVYEEVVVVEKPSE